MAETQNSSIEQASFVKMQFDNRGNITFDFTNLKPTHYQFIAEHLANIIDTHIGQMLLLDMQKYFKSINDTESYNLILSLIMLNNDKLNEEVPLIQPLMVFRNKTQQ